MLQKVITTEVRVIDKEKGVVDYVASDQSLDSYREIIYARGWRFDRFAKNAPFVDSHAIGDSIERQLGKVVDFKVEGETLVERVQWALDVPSNKLARHGFDMTAAGYLKAVSVGFVPERWVSKWSSDEKDFADAVALLNLTAEQAALCRAIYLEQQQIELSACIVGANPNAVARAFKAGVLSEEALSELADYSEKKISGLLRGVAPLPPSPISADKTEKTGGEPSEPAHGSPALSVRETVEFCREMQSITNREPVGDVALLLALYPQ